MESDGPPPMLTSDEARALHIANGDVKRPGHLIALSATFLGIAATCVGLRLYARIALRRRVNVDDGFIVLALLFLVGSLVTYIQEEKWGMGYHASTLTPNEIIHFFHAFWAMLWCYCGCLACVKLSLLFQYRKIFGNHASRFRIVANVLILVIGISGLWTVLSGIFMCWPISYVWTRQGDAKCMQIWPLFIGNAVLNIVTDLIVFLSPIPLLSRLHLPLRQKIILMAIFLTGFFVIIISGIRLGIFIRSNGATDFSWEQITLGSWSFVECAVAIVCASVPSLKPLVVHVFPKLASTFASRIVDFEASGDSHNKLKKINNDVEKGPNGSVGLFAQGGEEEHKWLDHTERLKSVQGGVQIVTAVDTDVEKK
ncbi:hypothetical protein BDZ85DRAFT_23445 [Elsinoe ampelina]|uniref:Rhodopsin domain-containing protein n=1 Tax=Elsinoe ampelina TaxID=302913 RepID=A0A6A6G660_9PEZI|nr:hypothetical protein BDZ85DRAFT_23445 [Elsinoe ampelina]